VLRLALIEGQARNHSLLASCASGLWLLAGCQGGHAAVALPRHAAQASETAEIFH
jgi:hypothetical protein